jgi:IS5 family transposase
MSHQEMNQMSFTDALVRDHKALHALDGVSDVLDWGKVERVLSPIYNSPTGRPSYPLLTLFRSLLLGCWYCLKDTQLEALKLWDALLAEVNRQLLSQNILMQSGHVSIIDASVIEAHQSGPGKREDGSETRDPEVGWKVKQNTRGKKTSTYGYSFHANVDEDGFIIAATLTPGNVHDSQKFIGVIHFHSPIRNDTRRLPSFAALWSVYLERSSNTMPWDVPGLWDCYGTRYTFRWLCRQVCAARHLNYSTKWDDGHPEQ